MTTNIAGAETPRFLTEGWTGLEITAVGTVTHIESKFNGDLAEMSIAINHSYKDQQLDEYVETGATKFKYIARKQYAAELVSNFDVGDRVAIVGAKFETRDYKTKDGGVGKSLEANFGKVSLVSKKKGSTAAPAGDGFTPGDDEDAGF